MSSQQLVLYRTPNVEAMSHYLFGKPSYCLTSQELDRVLSIGPMTDGVALPPQLHHAPVQVQRTHLFNACWKSALEIASGVDSTSLIEMLKDRMFKQRLFSTHLPREDPLTKAMTKEMDRIARYVFFIPNNMVAYNDDIPFEHTPLGRKFLQFPTVCV